MKNKIIFKTLISIVFFLIALWFFDMAMIEGSNILLMSQFFLGVLFTFFGLIPVIDLMMLKAENDNILKRKT